MTTPTEAMRQALDALGSPISRGPTWALIERYADAVCEYNTALRIDVGVDKAGAECLAIEKELRAHLTALRDALSAAPQPPAAPAGAVGEPVAPDGRLHADGYFTWARREGYVMDRRLPCDFYLVAPPARQALTDEQIDKIIFDCNDFLYTQDMHPRRERAISRAIERAHGIGGKGGADHG